MAHNTINIRDDLIAIERILGRYFWCDEIKGWRHVKTNDVLDALDGVFQMKQVLFIELYGREKAMLDKLKEENAEA